MPVNKAPKRWPPDIVAFYQTKVFGEQAYHISYYGRVCEIREVTRHDLFPDEAPNAKSNKHYYQVFLDRLDTLPQAIVSRRWRRSVFISTTRQKFILAEEINDLYDDSPLEDRLWQKLKNLNFSTERQWHVKIGGATYYFLDFALFCKQGSIAIEADGLIYTQRKQIYSDYKRENALQLKGWRILPFSGPQIRRELQSYCVPYVMKFVAGQLRGALEYCLEAGNQMSAWVIGEFASRNIVRDGTLKRIHTGAYINTWRWSGKVNQTTLELDITLRAGAPQVDFRLQVDWREMGTAARVQHLRVQFPLAVEDAQVCYEIPYGSLVRDTPNGEEVVGQRWADVADSGGVGMTLVNTSKYGYSLDGATLGRWRTSHWACRWRRG